MTVWNEHIGTMTAWPLEGGDILFVRRDAPHVRLENGIRLALGEPSRWSEHVKAAEACLAPDWRGALNRYLDVYYPSGEGRPKPCDNPGDAVLTVVHHLHASAAYPRAGHDTSSELAELALGCRAFLAAYDASKVDGR